MDEMNEAQPENGQAHPNAWPLPEDAFAHPRSAGSYTRFLAQYVRERQLLSWSDPIAKTSYLPAKYLEDAVTAVEKEGPAPGGHGC